MVMRNLKVDGHCERILRFTLRGRGITTLEAFKRFKCCRLSERIRELERRGHAFEREPFVSREGKRLVRYFLHQESAPAR